MGAIHFTANLQRHLACAPLPSRGGTLRQVLEDVFRINPQLRSYLLDEQQRLRPHVNIFINDHAIEDRLALSDRIAAEDDLYIFQALSGG